MPAFSRDLERTLHRALVIAGETGPQATLVHLASALCEDVFVGELLRACAIDLEPLRIRFRTMVGPVLDGPSCKEAKPDAAFNRVLQRAVIAAQAAGREHLGPPNIFVSLLDEDDGAVSTVLRDAGVTRHDALRFISHGLRKTRVEGNDAEVGDPSAPCAVKLFNDDHTPRKFVVSVLRDIFDYAEDDAVRLMHDIHRRGTAECGTYPRRTAAAKVAVVAKLARDGQHPLHCIMEPREV